MLLSIVTQPASNQYIHRFTAWRRWWTWLAKSRLLTPTRTRRWFGGRSRNSL